MLEEVQQAISACQVCCIDPSFDVTVFIIVPDQQPTGIIGQWDDKWSDPLHVLEWVFLLCPRHSQGPVQGPTVFPDGLGRPGRMDLGGRFWKVVRLAQPNWLD